MSAFSGLHRTYVDHLCALHAPLLMLLRHWPGISALDADSLIIILSIEIFFSAFPTSDLEENF